jgi:hypothetical protein
VLDASACGIARGVDLDAVTSLGPALLVSFDTPTQIAGTSYGQSDVLLFDTSGFALHTAAADIGIPAQVDVDGLHALEGEEAIAFSFDVSVVIDGQHFDDEDLALCTPTSDHWSMLADVSDAGETSRAADAQAIRFVPEPAAGAMWVAGCGLLTWLGRGRVVRRAT